MPAPAGLPRGVLALRCHHCGATAPVARRCPACGSPRIRYLGGGTERVEREVRERFPGLRVGRLDRDVVERRGAAARIVDAFADGELDVLVGTSLVTKGLDVPEVTLVGVVSADVALNLPDERAAERTYQLLAQAVGRAGRGERPGRALIQSYQPDHPAIGAVADGDAAAFVDAELACRPLRFAAVRRRYELTVCARGPRRRGRSWRAKMAGRACERAANRRPGARGGPCSGRCPPTWRAAGRPVALPRRPARRRSAGPARRRPGGAVERRRGPGEPALARASRAILPSMTVKPIVMLGDPRLRLKGLPVDSFGKPLHELLDDLTETMRAAPGVGLAAPQLGVALQACVIEVGGQLHELVNPRIVRAYGDDRDLEGCLSIPGYVAYVTRREKVWVVAQNRLGRKIKLAGTGSCRARSSTSSTISTASCTSTTSSRWTS